jgi:hypothetical protein
MKLRQNSRTRTQISQNLIPGLLRVILTRAVIAKGSAAPQCRTTRLDCRLERRPASEKPTLASLL